MCLIHFQPASLIKHQTCQYTDNPPTQGVWHYHWYVKWRSSGRLYRGWGRGRARCGSRLITCHLIRSKEKTDHYCKNNSLPFYMFESLLYIPLEDENHKDNSVVHQKEMLVHGPALGIYLSVTVKTFCQLISSIVCTLHWFYLSH